MKHFNQIMKSLLLFVCSMTIGLPQAKAQSSVIGGIEFYDDVFEYKEWGYWVDHYVGGIFVDYSFFQTGLFAHQYEGLVDYNSRYIEITGLKDFYLRHPEAASAIEIPATIGGIPVVDIAEDAFMNNRGIEHVYVRANLRRFQGFSYCTNLKNIYFEDDSQLAVIGRMALRKCTSLTRFTIPSNVRYIESQAFEGCTALENVSFEPKVSSLSRLGGLAFAGCTALNRFYIDKPLNVGICGQGVFNNVGLTTNVYNLELKPGMYEGAGLTSVIGSSNWKEIPKDCFPGCQLETINLERTNIETLNLNNLPQTALATEGLTLNEGLKSITGSWDGISMKTIVLPGSVEMVAKDAFKYVKDVIIREKSKLTHSLAVSAPNVETLWLDGSVPNDFARGCKKLKQINFFNGCRSVGERAFMDCPLLSGFAFETEGVELGKESFLGCSNLAIKGTVRAKSVGANAFNGCKFGAVKFVGTNFLGNSMAGLHLTARVELEDCKAEEDAFCNSAFTNLTVDKLRDFAPRAFKGTKGSLTYNALDDERDYSESPFLEAEFTTVTTPVTRINSAYGFVSMPRLERIVAPNLTTIDYGVTRDTPLLQGYDGLNNNSFKSVANKSDDGQVYYTVYSADMRTLYHVGETCGKTVKVAAQCQILDADAFRTSDGHTKVTVADLRAVTGTLALSRSVTEPIVPFALITPGTEAQFQVLANSGTQFITEYRLGDSNHDGHVDVEDVVLSIDKLGEGE